MSICPRCGLPCFYPWQTYHDRCIGRIDPEELYIDYTRMNEALDKAISKMREGLSKQVIHIEGGEACAEYLRSKPLRS